MVFILEDKYNCFNRENLVPKEFLLEVSKFTSDKFLFKFDLLFDNIKGRPVFIFFMLIFIITIN